MKKFAENILELPHQCKTDSNTVKISVILPQNNNLNEDAIKVNKILSEGCRKGNIGFIDNEIINPRYNYNQSDLSLNKRFTFREHLI